MPTTSLKLPDDLKERARFVVEARAARKEMLKSSLAFDADEVHAYVRARAAGKATGRPKAKPWRG